MPTDDYARAKGWHIWRWSQGAESAVGPALLCERALCPGHAGNGPRVKATPVEGEVPLW